MSCAGANETKAAWKAAPGASASKKAAPRLLLRAPAYAHTPHMQLGIGRERRPCDIRKRRRERKRRRGKRKRRRRRRRRRRGSGKRRGRTEEEEIRGGEGGGRRARRKEKKRGRRRRREKEEEEEAGEEGEEEEEEEEEQTPQNTTKKQKYQHPGSNWRPIFFSPAAGLSERRTQLNTQTQPKPNRSRHAIGGWVDCQGGSPPFLRQCWFGNPPSRAFGVLIRVAPYGYALRGCTNAVKGLLVEELGEGREKVLECLLGYLEVVVTWQ